MKDYEFSIPAGEARRRDVKGQFIKVKTATVELQVVAETLEGRVIANLNLNQGGDVTLAETFDKVRVVNPAGADTEATLIIGMGNSKDNQLSGQVSIGQGQSIAAANHPLTTADSEILAADGSRRSVIVQNVDSSIDVYIGAAGVTAADGVKIPAGHSLTLDKSAAAAIYAVADSGTPEVRTLSEGD